MDKKERTRRIRRSLQKGICAWCGKPIPGWPDQKGTGDNTRGRFCSVSCNGNMHGSEYIQRHKKKLKASEN